MLHERTARIVALPQGFRFSLHGLSHSLRMCRSLRLDLKIDQDASFFIEGGSDNS